MYNKRLSTLRFVYLPSPGCVLLLLAIGDTAVPSGLYARLRHTFLVISGLSLEY